MTAVLKVWWTFFTALPLQRVLAYVGIAGFALGAIFTVPQALEGRAAGLGAVLGATFGPLILFPAIFIAGPLFRLLSAPRPHRFLPHFRVRMLVAFVAFVASVALAISFASWLVVPEGRWSIDAALIAPVVFASLIVLAMFVASGSLLGATAVVIAMVVLMSWAAGGGTARLEASGVNLTPWFGIASALLWLIFAGCYLRARRIRTIDMGSFSIEGMAGSLTQGSAARAPVSLRTDIARDEAAHIWAAGPRRRSLAMQVPGVMLSALVLLLLVRYVFAARPAPSELPLFGIVAGLVVSPMLFLITNRIARHSRHLWLRLPGSRVELLRVVERLAGRQCALLVLFALCVSLGAPFAMPGMSFGQGIAVFVITVSGGVYAFFAGLALVTERHMPWVASLLVFFASQGVAVAVILIEPFHAGWFAGVVVFHVLAALLLRLLAVHTWRRIDWLKFKPVRIASQASRS